MARMTSLTMSAAWDSSAEKIDQADNLSARFGAANRKSSSHHEEQQKQQQMQMQQKQKQQQ